MYGKQLSITSFNTCIEMAAPLKGLIFDAVYGSWIFSLPLFTLGGMYVCSKHFVAKE